MVIRRSLTCAFLTASGFGLLAGTSAFAQEAASQPADAQAQQNALPDIVVTAERRSSSVQRTAASITVKTGDELRKEGKYLLRDILENAPGIAGGAAEAANGTAGGGTDTAGAGIVIRGMQSSQGAGGSNTSTAAAVAVYVDDVYEGVGGGYDLDRVEVLRGPQGTLYGRSATGGVVAIHTRDPDLNDVGGMGLAELGNYSLRHFSGALNVPVVEDKLAVRVAGDYYHRDGFETDDGLGHRVSKNARIKLLAKPTENLSILLGAALQDNKDATGGRTPRFDASGDIYYTDELLGSGKNKFRQYWADIQWDMGWATLTYIPAWRSWKQDALNVAAGPGFTVNQTLLTPKDHFFTNEARLSSDSASKLKWQAGVLTYYNNVHNSNTVRFSLPGNPLAFSAVTQKKTRAVGIFGEATYPITDAWRVTGGLRYDKTKVDVAEDYTGPTGVTLSLSPQEGRRRFSNWTYKLRTEYDLTPENLLYASFSTGFSPGDVSVTTDATGQPMVIQLKDQTLKAYEIGSKNRFLGNKLQVNGSIFYYDYSGYQNSGIDVDPRPGPNIAFATLVSPQKTIGGELELTYQLTRHDRIAMNLAYTRARYVDRPAQFQEFIARRAVSQVPPFTATLAYSHSFDISDGSSLTLSADGRYLAPHDGGIITAEQLALGGLPLIRVSSTAIANLNATWTSSDRRFSLSAYVRNVTDKRYFLEASIESSPGSIAGGSLQLYAPRTFGAIASVNF